MERLPNWPPRDWRALVALVFSVAGAVALTLLLYLLADMLLPAQGWGEGSEAERVTTIRWVLWICAFCILLVLTGLGFATTRRGLRMKSGDKSMEWEGGDKDAADDGGNDVQEDPCQVDRLAARADRGRTGEA